MGHLDWLENADWRSSGRRSRARADINAALAEDTVQKPSAHWVELLEGVGIPCGPIYSIDQAFADPQVKHLGMAAAVDHPRLGPTHMVASPLNLSGVDKAIRCVAPVLPEDTDAVLASVGYSGDEIAAMRASGAV
jgi:formyl-CoA transferase